MDSQPPDPAHPFIAAITGLLTKHLAQQPTLPGLGIADIRTDLADGGHGYFG